MSLFAQGRNKNSIKTKASQKKHTHTQHKENILKTRKLKHYKVKEFTNVVRISNLIFVADKVQVEIPCRLSTATNLDTMPRDKTGKTMLSIY